MALILRDYRCTDCHKDFESFSPKCKDCNSENVKVLVSPVAGSGNCAHGFLGKSNTVKRS